MASHPFEVDGVDYDLKPAREDRPGWEIRVNGEVMNARTLTAINRTMGIGFGYGQSPVGEYNQGRLVNRGGAVIVPTFGNYFLLQSQLRPLVGPEEILEFPRGQARLGEGGIETARRELMEEMGINIADENLVYLGAYNPDTALIHGANVHFWWLPLPNSLAKLTEHGAVLLQEVVADLHSKWWEKIREPRFVLDTEIKSSSMMTMMGMGLVLQARRRAKRAIANRSSSGETVEYD